MILARVSRRTKNWRPWRFSLRAFFVVFTIGAVWLGALKHRADQQREVVAWLNALQAVVTYDYAYDTGTRWFTDARSSYPDWLRTVVGDDYLHNVVSVELHVLERPLSDEDVAQIRRLPALSYLCIGAVQRPKNEMGTDDAPITDVQLEQLAALPALADLEIEDARSITDAGVAAIAR